MRSNIYQQQYKYPFMASATCSSSHPHPHPHPSPPSTLSIPPPHTHLLLLSSTSFLSPTPSSSFFPPSLLNLRSCHAPWPLPPHRLPILAKTESSQAKQQPQQQEKNVDLTPSWARPGSEDPPPWERKQAAVEPAFEVPFAVYLIASAIVAIAAVGSVFEYLNQKPVFGVVYPDSPLYTPILGFFALTGLPTAGFLWFKSIESANKAAEEQDREDGFLD